MNYYNRCCFGMVVWLLLFGLFGAIASAQTVLTNNVPVTNLSGAAGSQVFYQIVVAAAQTKLEIRITGTGDCDLYVKRGSQPTTHP